MTKTEIFQKMIDSWLTKDVHQFLSVLTENIMYTECYGPQYNGKTECEKWFRQWTAPDENVVKSWTVKEAYADGNTGFFTWTFDYVFEGEANIFDGISLVEFEGNLISEIREFGQKHEKYRPFQEKI